MKDKKINLTAIIISAIFLLIIGGLCFFGIKTINEKNREIEETEQKLQDSQKKLEASDSELSDKKTELDIKISEYETLKKDYDDNLSELNELLAAEEERLKAEQDTTAADEAEAGAIINMQLLLDDVRSMVNVLKTSDFEFDDSELDIDIEQYCTRYEECKKGFTALRGVPENILAAGAEIMNISGDYIYECRDLVKFAMNYLDAVELFGDYWDIMSKARSTTEMANKCYRKIEELIGKLDEMECPAYFEPLWDRWKKTVELVHTFTFRIVEGIDTEDYLKINSAYNLIMRIIKIIDNLNTEMVNIIDDEDAFTDTQLAKADLIYEEISKAAEQPYGERGNYTFVNSFAGEVSLNYKTIENIYPALYNSYDHFVFLEAACISGVRDVVIECEIPGLTQKYEQKYSLNSHTMPIYLKPSVSSETMNLSTAWDSNIKITVKDLSGNLLDTKSFPVHILSINDFKWYDDEFGVSSKDNILCFLAPESDAITKLKRDAIDILSEITDGGFNYFTGYQGPVYTKYVDTYIQAAALMIAMSDTGVRYNMDPFSIDGADQHIMFPEQVLENKSGLCIETSLVIASALQSAGMHTYLVFPTGHAQVAVETWEGSGEYFLIETTDIPCSWDDFEDYAAELINDTYDNRINSPIIYYNSKEWNNYISRNDVYLVDCSDGKLLGLTPFSH